MAHHKIIFIGPVGAGKTTAIRSISEIDTVNTDVSANALRQYKNTPTTVAMDYGMMRDENGDKIHLYGTPGQKEFDFMWQILASGGTGIILLLNNSGQDPSKDLRFFMSAFERFFYEHKVVLGINQTDDSGKYSIGEYQGQCRNLAIDPPIISVDARIKQDILGLVHTVVNL